MNKLIITHPGSAHFDDFFAISLVLAVNNDVIYTIERRHPTDEELANPEIWVIDVGMKLEPDLKNFDHHQSTDTPASFMLVADYLGLTPTLSITPWWEFKDKFDRFGPFKIADELGIENLLPFISPIEDWFLKLFTKNPGEIYPLMRSFGQNVIKGARTLFSQFEFWANSETCIVKNKTVLIGLTNDSTGVQHYSSQMDSPAEISVSYDGRGKGWRLARLNDAKGVDFSKLEGDEKIKFAHKTGFIAKTKHRIPVSEVIRLVEKAITD
ncbi:MAG: MYG1 family protein [Desulfobacteraceae bacterium]|nr:MYG1 family protein [Desulfobacteraceae bacterium]